MFMMLFESTANWIGGGNLAYSPSIYSQELAFLHRSQPRNISFKNEPILRALNSSPVLACFRIQPLHCFTNLMIGNNDGTSNISTQSRSMRRSHCKENMFSKCSLELTKAVYYGNLGKPLQEKTQSADLMVTDDINQVRSWEHIYTDNNAETTYD